MGKHWRFCRSSWTESVRTPISRIGMGKTVRGSSVEAWMGKSTELGMSICSSKTRIILIGVRGRHKKWLERSRMWLPCGRNWWKKRWSWRTHIISWSRIFGMHSTWMQSERNHYLRVQTNVWIPYFCWSNWKITRIWKSLTQRGLHSLTTWKDMLENVLNDCVNWQTWKWSSSIEFQVLVWMTINSNRKNLNQWENYHKYAHKVS